MFRSYLSCILFLPTLVLPQQTPGSGGSLPAPPLQPSDPQHFQQAPPPSPVVEPPVHAGKGHQPLKNPYCHNVERIIFEDQCEPYVEKTCWTTNQEDCQPVVYQNCTGVIETTVEEQCFPVVELVCDMVESIIYETLEETYQVQKCFNAKDRVCDTTHKIDMTIKDDYQCTTVETPNCFMEEKTIEDVTCINTMEFDCKKAGNESMRELQQENYPGGPVPEVVCERNPHKECNNIPRQIKVEVCSTEVNRFCKQFSNVFPFTIQEQKCHFEPKKVCELEMKTRPKKAKKYTYKKDCKEEAREICDEVEKKSVKEKCEDQERLSCKYVPMEQCNTEDKKYCHKVEKVVVEEVCDTNFHTW